VCTARFRAGLLIVGMGVPPKGVQLLLCWRSFLACKVEPTSCLDRPPGRLQSSRNRNVSLMPYKSLRRKGAFVIGQTPTQSTPLRVVLLVCPPTHPFARRPKRRKIATTIFPFCFFGPCGGHLDRCSSRNKIVVAIFLFTLGLFLLAGERMGKQEERPFILFL